MPDLFDFLLLQNMQRAQCAQLRDFGTARQRIAQRYEYGCGEGDQFEHQHSDDHFDGEA